MKPNTKSAIILTLTALGFAAIFLLEGCSTASLDGITTDFKKASAATEGAASKVAALPGSSFVASVAGNYAAGRILANLGESDRALAGKAGSVFCSTMYTLTGKKTPPTGDEVKAAAALGGLGLTAGELSIYDSISGAATPYVVSFIGQYPNSSELLASFFLGMETRFNAGN